MDRIKEMSSIPYRTIMEFVPYGRQRGHSVCIAYGRSQVQPWAIGYQGVSNAYFSTIAETLAYAAGKNWIQKHMISKQQYEVEQCYKAIFGQPYDGD